MLLGKVRNWSAEDAHDLDVRLHIDDKEIATKKLNVNGRSATQVAFELPESHATEFDGYLEVAEGGPKADDRRYFSYSPPRQSRIAIVAGEAEPSDRSGAWFFLQALPESAKSPWRARVVTAESLVPAPSVVAPPTVPEPPKVVLAFEMVTAPVAAPLFPFTNNVPALTVVTPV